MHTLKRIHKPLVINETEAKQTEGSANGGRLFYPITVKYKKIIKRGVKIFYSSSHSQKKREGKVMW